MKQIILHPFYRLQEIVCLATTFALFVMPWRLESQNFPIALTSGSFNFDCVAEASPPSSSTSGPMPGGDDVYSPSYPGAPAGTGMPASNTVSSGGITYNLQAYTGMNALQLGSTNGSSGVLTLQSPASADQLHFLAFSVFGTTNVDIVVTFSDNSTEQIATNHTISDWFNGSSVAYTLNGRITYSGNIYNVNSGNPRLYTYTFNISAGNLLYMIKLKNHNMMVEKMPI